MQRVSNSKKTFNEDKPTMNSYTYIGNINTSSG